MFERFTQDARDVVISAQGEARRLRHPGIGTSHLLLALISGGSPVANLLIERGVTRQAAEKALAEILGSSAPPSDSSAAGGPATAAEQRADDAKALAALGIDLDRIRNAVEAAFGPGALDHGGADDDGRHSARPGPLRRTRKRPDLDDEAGLLRGKRAGGGHIPFGADAKKALELSLREALRLRDRSIGAEHLLLGLLRPGDTIAVGILELLHVDPADLRRAVEQREHRRSA